MASQQARNEELRALTRRALDHLHNHSTDQAPAPMRMPIDAYTSTERYRAERQRIFRELPLALALSLELPGPGSCLAVTAVDVPVLLVRGTDGVVRAFINVCRHRGARLRADGPGTVDRIVCPYHGWQYDDHGALAARYAADTFGYVDHAALGLQALPCAERSGLVWVMLSPGADFDIDTWLGGFGPELDTLALDCWHLFEQREIPGPGWKVTMDGYLEAYHHNLVHGRTVGKHTVGNLVVLDTWGPHQRMTFARRSIAELAGRPEQQWQPGADIRLIHSGFPNLSVSGILGDHCLVSHILPGATPDTTVTRQTVLVAKPPHGEAELEASRTFSEMVRMAVQDEDYTIGFDIQAGITAGANHEFIFGRNEPAVQNYHRWIARFMEQGVGVDWQV